jgi:hypothetical protein
MSANAIAKVIGDLRAGRITTTDRRVYGMWLESLALPKPVIDCTKVYEQWIQGDTEAFLYEDHVFFPVFDDVFLAYANEHGNVNVIHIMSVPRPEDGWQDHLRWKPRAEHDIDWDSIAYVSTMMVYVGGTAGMSVGRPTPIPTWGPMHGWAIAATAEGEIQDIRWTKFLKDDPDEWTWANCLISTLKTYTFLACRNVETQEPRRDRTQHRQIARLIGNPEMKISEICVRPIGKSYGGSRGASIEGTMPLHIVRGHMAHYGPKYGKGLLFGKYEGKFWIQPHAKGRIEAGERRHEYSIEVDP